MLWPEKNSDKEFDNEKKFLRLGSFLMVRPLSVNWSYSTALGRAKGGRADEKKKPGCLTPG